MCIHLYTCAYISTHVYTSLHMCILRWKSYYSRFSNSKTMRDMSLSGKEWSFRPCE